MVQLMSAAELHDRLDEVTSGPMARALLGLLMLVVTGLSSWTLIEVQYHSTLLEHVSTHQNDMDKSINDIGVDFKEVRDEMNRQAALAAALKQRLDDLPVPRPAEH